MSEGLPTDRLITHAFFESLRTPREEKAKTYKPPQLKKSLMFSPVTIKKLQRREVDDSDSLIEQMESLSLSSKSSKAKAASNKKLSDMTNVSSSTSKRSTSKKVIE